MQQQLITPARRSIVRPSMRPMRRAPLRRRGRIDTVDRILQFIRPTFGGTPTLAVRNVGGFPLAIPEHEYGDASRGGGSGSGRSCCCNVCADCKFGTVGDYWTSTSSGITMGDCSGTCYTGAPLLPNTFHDDFDDDPTSMNFSKSFSGVTAVNKSGFILSGRGDEGVSGGGLQGEPNCNYSVILESGVTYDCLNPSLADLTSSVYDNATCTLGLDGETDEDVISSIMFPTIQWLLQKNATTGSGSTWKGWLLQGVFPLCGGDGAAGNPSPLCANSFPNCNPPNFAGIQENFSYFGWVVFPLMFFLGFIDTSADSTVDCGQTLTFDNLITASCATGSYTLPDSTVINYFGCGSGGTVVLTPHIPTVP